MRRTAPREDVEAALDAIGIATADLDAPLAALYLPALRANVADLRRRSGGTRIRLASKSIRCRGVLREVLGPELSGDDGIRGVMAYSPQEAVWLVHSGCRDVLMGYPTVHRAGLAEIGADPVALESVTLMVDDTRQLEIAREAGAVGARVCIDVDASLRIGPVHLGVRRSPLRTVGQVRRIAEDAVAMGFRPVGVMFYEAQVAGMPDDVRGISVVKRASMRRLSGLRAQVAAAVGQVAGRDPEIVNSGGSGSVSESAADPAVTEVTAGSGLYVPRLFDRYRSFTPRPALFFALPAVRIPAPGMTTFAYGGYVASGVPGPDRVPTPERPVGLQLVGTEGVGEVQTPVTGSVGIGGRSWWRHAKAGELCERFGEIHVVDEVAGRPAVVDLWPTYRGAGKCVGGVTPDR